MAETSFESLHKFRALSADEKLESLFLGQLETLLKQDAMLARQDVTNGNVKRTKESLESHLDEHDAQQNGIDFIRKWGARGTGLVLLGLAILGGIEAVVLIVHYGR